MAGNETAAQELQVVHWSIHMGNGLTGRWRLAGGTVWGYALAVLAVAAATLLRWTLPGTLAGTPYLAFYPAVAAAAAFGGMGPGLLATIGSALCVDLLFDVTPGRVNWSDPVTLGRLAIFLAGGTGVSLVAGMQRAAQARQRQQAEQLRESEQRLRASFDNAALGIIEVDADDRVVAVNDRLCQLLGYSRQEMLGMTVHELTAPEDRASSDQFNAQLHAGHTDRIDYEKHYLKRDGSRLWVHVTVSAVRDSTGRWMRSVGTVEDISLREAAQAQLRLQAAALEAAANGIAITDSTGTIVWVNRAFTELTGYSRNELIGQNPRIFKSGEQDDAFYRTLWQTIRQGRVWHGELVNRRKDGTLYPEEMTITPLRDGQGAIIHFITIKQDVTVRKAQQEALAAARISAENAKSLAEEANAAKDHFLAILSHELRTPLMPVLAAVSMLQATPELDQATREAMEMVRRNIELEARLIDDLLDVTRIERGKVELARRPVDLATVITHAIDVCRPDIEARGLHFDVDWGEPPYCVKADIARLQQVFWNLLKNAIKFTPHGGRLGIRCRRDHHTAVVEVTDSGIGIEADALPRLFDAFEQAERSITRQFGGLGLGLTISKSLVEMHGGRIEAHSEGKGKGATFRVTLPLHLAPDEPATDHAAASAGAQAAARPLHILLVEDHGDTAKVMRQLLMLDGHTVKHAGDVATALDLASKSSFDLLISDLGLPDRSGLDLMRELRSHKHTLPGIALSGYGQEQDIRRSREAGFAAHLIKPTNPDQLADAIAHVMGARHERNARAQA